MAKHFKGWRKHTGPTLDLNGGTGGINHTLVWDEGDGATALCPSAVTTGGTFNAISSLTMTLTGVADGGDEVLVVAGVSFPLNANKSDTGAVGGTTFAVAYTTSTQTFVITKNGGGLAWHGDWQSLLRGITYNNVASPDPTEGDRTIDITVSDGVLTSPTATCIISVTAANTLFINLDLNATEPGVNLAVTFREGDAMTAICPSATLSDSGGDLITILTMVGSGITADDEIVKLGTSGIEFPLISDATTTVTSGVTTFAVAYTASTKTFVVTKNGGGGVADTEWQAFARDIKYVNDSSPVTEGERTLTITCTDGTLTSEPAVLTINVVNPYIPSPPLEYITTTYSLPTGGTTRNVNAGGDLQAAINASVPGDVIVLEAGATFTGNFNLPATDGSDWIYIISSALASLPEGTRVTPDKATHMPRLHTTNTGRGAVWTSFGAKKWRLCGIEMTSSAANHIGIAFCGYGNNDLTTYSATTNELPHDIIFDRCYIHSISTSHKCRIGISLNGIRMSVVDSCIANIKDSTDAQAIITWNGNGPYKIANNFLEATGENYLTGGNDPLITNSVPSDIEFNKNYCLKRRYWRANDLSWGVKNLFELKNAQRVKCTGNIFENTWTDAQAGIAILFTVRNQSGNAPWSVLTDIDYRHNLLRNTAGAFLVTGSDDIRPSQQTHRVRISNNICERLRLTEGTNTGIQMESVLNQPLRYMTFTNNVMASAVEGFNYMYIPFYLPLNQIAVDGLKIQNNITEGGQYNTTIAGRANAYDMSDNHLWYDSDSSRYTTQYNYHETAYPSNTKSASLAAVDFVDAANGNFRLNVTSPIYGSGKGVDQDALEAELPTKMWYIDLSGFTGNGNATATWSRTGGTPSAATTIIPKVVLLHSHKQYLTSATLTAGGILDGVSEVFTIGGTTFPQNADKTATGTGGSTTFAIAYTTSNGVFAITKSGGGTFDKEDLESLLAGITYVNSGTATAGARTLAVVANDGTDNTTSRTCTITVSVL